MKERRWKPAACAMAGGLAAFSSVPAEAAGAGKTPSLAKAAQANAAKRSAACRGGAKLTAQRHVHHSLRRHGK